METPPKVQQELHMPPPSPIHDLGYGSYSPAYYVARCLPGTVAVELLQTSVHNTETYLGGGGGGLGACPAICCVLETLRLVLLYLQTHRLLH